MRHNNNQQHKKQRRNNNNNNRNQPQNHVFHGRINRQRMNPNFHPNNKNNNNTNNSIHSRLSVPFASRVQQQVGNDGVSNGRRRNNKNNNHYNHKSFFNQEVRDKKPELCKWHIISEGGCNFPKCNYMHEEFPCKYHWVVGYCPDKGNCKLNHVSLSETDKEILLTHIEKAPAQLIGDFPRFNRLKCQNMIKQVEQRESHKQAANFAAGRIRSDSSSLDFSLDSLQVSSDDSSLNFDRDITDDDDSFSVPFCQPTTTKMIKTAIQSQPRLCRTINNNISTSSTTTTATTTRPELPNQLNITKKCVKSKSGAENNTQDSKNNGSKPPFHTIIESMMRLMMKHGVFQRSESKLSSSRFVKNDKSPHSGLAQLNNNNNSAGCNGVGSPSHLLGPAQSLFGQKMSGDAKVVMVWQNRQILSPETTSPVQISRSPFIRPNNSSPIANGVFNVKNSNVEPESTVNPRKSIKDRLGFNKRDSASFTSTLKQVPNPNMDKTRNQLDVIIKACTSDSRPPFTTWEIFEIYLKCLENKIPVPLSENSPL